MVRGAPRIVPNQQITVAYRYSLSIVTYKPFRCSGIAELTRRDECKAKKKWIPRYARDDISRGWPGRMGGMASAEGIDASGKDISDEKIWTAVTFLKHLDSLPPAVAFRILRGFVSGDFF